jgi:hypothetical protein
MQKKHLLHCSTDVQCNGIEMCLFLMKRILTAGHKDNIMTQNMSKMEDMTNCNIDRIKFFPENLQFL